MITIGSDTTTTISATTLDQWMIDTGVTVDTAGLGIDASGAVSGRGFIIKGALKSVSGPAMQVGDASLADSKTEIRIESVGSISSGGAGIVAASGGLKVIVGGNEVSGAGSIVTVGNAIELRQGSNALQNDGTIESTAASAILSTGAGDSISSSGAIRAASTAIVSNGDGLSYNSYGQSSLVSTAGAGIVSTGANLIVTSTAGGIQAKLDAVVTSGVNAKVGNYAIIQSADGAGVMSTGDGLSLESTARIEGTTFGVSASGANTAISSYAEIVSREGTGIAVSGDNADIISTVLVRGKSFGIQATGAAANIENTGTVRADGTAILATGDASVVVTSAKLVGAIGLRLGGEDSTATNYNVIRATSKSDAAVILSESADSNHISGTISAKSGTAISADSGDNAIFVGALVKGDIKLGGGNDWFGAPYGEVKGKVYGGKGDDIYEVGIGVDIVERKGQGNDTIKAMYTWKLGNNIENLELVGNEAADAIGNKLANVLTGNVFANKFWGAGGRDIFVQQAKTGRDTIMDFEDGKDLIDFRGVDGIDGMGDLRGHMRAVGDDVLIRVTGDGLNVNLTVVGVELRDLTVSDFLF